MSAKILILGGSSYVGRHLLAHLGPDRAVGTYNSTPFAGGVRFDSLSMRIADIIDDPKAFSHALVLLGDTQPDSCIADPRKSHALNVASVCALFDELAELNIKPVFASTEFVFDGQVGNYAETDNPRPILLYGAQKLQVENYLCQLGIRHAILRFSKVYGIQPNDGTLFADWADQMKPGMTIRCAADQAFSPVFVGDVAEAIERVVDRNLEGLFHLSGNRRFSRLELLELFLDIRRRQHGSLEVNVERCSIDDFKLPEKRPKDVSMIADRISVATDLKFADTEEMCAKVITQAAKSL
jgi:dTDP-4-dehydrorhamnose reductase